jgi:hypothetical protein
MVTCYKVSCPRASTARNGVRVASSLKPTTQNLVIKCKFIDFAGLNSKRDALGPRIDTGTRMGENVREIPRKVPIFVFVALVSLDLERGVKKKGEGVEMPEKRNKLPLYLQFKCATWVVRLLSSSAAKAKRRIPLRVVK